ncbi:cytochrome P450 [Klebsiella pneumoniae]|nr:cytochrome P450 [Klebsiella pneumoniae]
MTSRICCSPPTIYGTGNWMTYGDDRPGYDDLKDNTSTTGELLPLRSDNTAKTATTRCWPCTTNNSSHGLAPGVSESALQYGVGLGAAASAGERWRSHRGERRASPALASYGILPLENWQLAPSRIAQHSEDRYRDKTATIKTSTCGCHRDLRSLRPAV